MLCVPCGAGAQAYKCVAKSGGFTYSDAPCSAGLRASPLKLPASAHCPRYIPRTESRLQRTYRLPDERAALVCEIAGAKAMIARYQSKLRVVTSPATSGVIGIDGAGRAAIAEQFFSTRANLSDEEAHLVQLERQRRP